MAEQLPKDGYTPDDPYNPADEYTPLDALFDETETKSAAEPVKESGQPSAEAGEEAAADVNAPANSTKEPSAQPQQGYPYPAAPVYPYPVYGAPYMQPQQSAPPYYPGYPAAGPMFDPRQGAVPPYPVQQPFYAYPAPPAPQPAPQPVESKPEQPRRERPATSAGTKAYLIVLTAVMLAMIAAFTVYVSIVANKDKESLGVRVDLPDSSETLPAPLTPDNGISDDPFDTPNGGSIKQFDEEITLIEDKGETQQRDNDNEDSVGTPDPKAKGVELASLPKDKDNAKYTTQYAYENVSDSVVTVEIFEGKITDNSSNIIGLGTGTIISSDGYLITNAHVIQNCKHYAVKIVMNSGESYQAKIVGYDTWTDIAVLKIEAENLKPVVFGDSADIVIGQDVIAVGSPGGEKFQNSLTKGVVSAIGREISVNKYVRYIQSDAAISPGSSGGPLCNIYGQVIGINTAKTVADNYEAMTFSIPSAKVKEIVNELLHYGYVRGRTRIGFAGTEITSQQMQYYGVPAGLLVSTVDPTGALADTDIRESDIITAVDGKKVSTFQDVYVILDQHKPGDKITISVYRVE